LNGKTTIARVGVFLRSFICVVNGEVSSLKLDNNIQNGAIDRLISFSFPFRIHQFCVAPLLVVGVPSFLHKTRHKYV